MQTWMRTRLAEPAAMGKLGDVADALTLLGQSPPDPAWARWAEISLEGAAAARRGDAAAVRRSCRACHESFRRTYRKKHRLRPAPP